MNTNLILFIVFLTIIVFMIFYSKWRKRSELKGNLEKLNELLSLNQINPRDKATIEGFVMGKFYNKKKFEGYIAEAKDIKKRMNAQALVAKQKLETRRNELVGKYGEEVTVRLLKQESWIGMSKEQLLDSRGEPTKIERDFKNKNERNSYLWKQK
ncbi:MAG: hypothetical protein WDN75_21665 [Bacteroidota bacterium]